MHIAFLTSEYPHKRTGNSGGMGTSIKNLVSELVTQEVKVSVFVYGQTKDDFFEERGINFYLFKQLKYRFGGFYLYRKHINFLLNKIIKKEKIDILEVPDWTGISAFMKFKIPVVMRFHGSDTYFCHIEGRKQKWKNRFFEKRAVKNSDGYIAPTRFAGEKSAELFDLKFSEVEVIPYGLVLSDFENPNPPDYKSLSLLNIGTLIRKKGVFELMKIFNQLVELEPNATLTLIGADSKDIQTGSDSTWSLMQDCLSEKAKARVLYKGKISYDQVRGELLKANVCVFPSLAETLGMVTIEAMALQKAVVNTSIGWAKDIIDHSINGFMHHPEETNKFVQSIKCLFDQPSLVQEIGFHARQKVEQKFSIGITVKKNLAFYKKVIQ
tara:strand:+ start:555 stop:1700 length:1146 start_codon:yes stop_codon:yes gene_type:complete